MAFPRRSTPVEPAPFCRTVSCFAALAEPDWSSALRQPYILPIVTAVTARDAFGVDLTFVQTYSQAEGDV